jgi:endonuclease G
MVLHKFSKLFILLFPILISCEVYNSKHESNNDNKDSKISLIVADTNKQYIYLPLSEGQIVHHNSYSLAYSEKHEQAIWVYYFLTSEMINGKFSRKDNFRVDEKIIHGSATLSDYKGSGFDRGHLVPAADMKNSHISMSESFLFSNISPQVPSFNRGVWRKLELLFRHWVGSEGDAYIATGPILTDSLGSIGENQVTIPNSFYKIIYCDNKEKMIGFIIPNKKSNNFITDYVTTIDSIESITNIDFFGGLDDTLEQKLESNVNLMDWNFKK